MILASIYHLEESGLDTMFGADLLDHMHECSEHKAGNRKTLDNGVFCFDSECETSGKPASSMPFENHRKYIDIHLVIEGVERIVINDPDILTRATDYDEDRDKEFFTSEGQPRHQILLKPGECAVLFPGEAHLCCLAEDKPALLKKRIYKVPVSNLGGEKSRL